MTGAPNRGEREHVAGRHSHDVLLLVDVLSAFEHEGGAELYEEALRVTPAIRELAAAARRAKVQVIYLNDNFGRWVSSADDVYRWASSSRRGRVASALRPRRNDLRVLKPARSGFFASPLELLLEQLEAERLVLAGFSTDQCVLATAGDAVLRKFRVAVPSNCTASQTSERSARALALLDEGYGVDVRPSHALAWLGRASARPTRPRSRGIT